MMKLIQLFGLLCIVSSFALCNKIRFNRRDFDLSPLHPHEFPNSYDTLKNNKLVMVRKNGATFKNSSHIVSTKDYVFTRWNNLINPENTEIFKFPKEMKTRIKFPEKMKSKTMFPIKDTITVVIDDNHDNPLKTIENSYGINIFYLSENENEMESFLQELHQKYGYNVVAFKVSNNVVKLHMNKELRSTIVNMLLDLDFVYHIEYAAKMEVQNKFTRASVQGGNGVPSTYTPYYNIGIHGENQLVSIYDTGINYFHYFFWDGNKTFEQETIDLNRRKIVGFRVPDIGSGLTPTYYDFNGHGTHCSGTIAGDTNQTGYQDFVGVAYKAKLHVTGAAYQDANKKQYSLLEATDNDIFYKPYSFGIRIFSESWGTSPPNTLVYPFKMYTVNYDGTTTTYTQIDCVAEYGVACDDLNAHYDSRSQSIDTFLYNNDDAVVMLAAGNQGSWSDKYTVNSPGTAKNVIAVGALSGSSEQMNYGLGVIQFTDQAAAILYSPEALSYSYDVNITTNRQYYSNELLPGGIYDKHTLAYFSSHGPTRDLRIKPELVTTGFIYSSYRGATQAEAATVMNFIWGTSMATPAVSGAAALVRQYIVEGRKKDMEGKTITNPPGSLIKAMLIHATIQPTDTYVKFGSLQKKLITQWPNVYFGFGILKLDEALQLDSSKYRLFYKTNTISLQKHRYLFAVPDLFSQYKVKATLVWYDQPGEIGAEGDLINDLDLKIICGLSSATGNSGYEYNNGGPDRINPVEQASILCRGPLVEVTVTPYYIQNPQKYSLVVTVDNTNTLLNGILFVAL